MAGGLLLFSIFRSKSVKNARNRRARQRTKTEIDGPEMLSQAWRHTERILQVKPSNRFELGFSYSVSDSPIVGPSDLKKLGYIIVPR